MLKEALVAERRKNRRLRDLISALQVEVARDRHDLDVQFARLAQIQAVLDRLALEQTRKK